MLKTDLSELSSLEREIYELLKIYIDYYQNLNLGEIVPFCNQKMEKDLKRDTLEKTISSVIEKRYILEDKELIRSDILENEMRKELYQFIQKHPGSYNRLIRDKLDLHSNEFEWHTSMLEKFGFIKKVRLNKRQWGFFINKSYMEHEYDLFLLQKKKVQKIIDFVQNEEQTGVSQISNQLGMHYSTVKKYLDKLEERELVFRVKKHGTRGYNYHINIDLLMKLRKIINGQVFLDFAETPTVV